MGISYRQLPAARKASGPVVLGQRKRKDGRECAVSDGAKRMLSGVEYPKLRKKRWILVLALRKCIRHPFRT